MAGDIPSHPTSPSLKSNPDKTKMPPWEAGMIKKPPFPFFCLDRLLPTPPPFLDINKSICCIPSSGKPLLMTEERLGFFLLPTDLCCHFLSLALRLGCPHSCPAGLHGGASQMYFPSCLLAGMLGWLVSKPVCSLKVFPWVWLSVCTQEGHQGHSVISKPSL